MPDGMVEMETRFGALAIAWAEGSGAWLNAGAADLFGFPAPDLAA